MKNKPPFYDKVNLRVPERDARTVSVAKRRDFLKFSAFGAESWSLAKLLFSFACIALGIGLFYVLLEKDFDFSEISHRVLSNNFEIFSFSDWIQNVHSVIPDSWGVLNVLEDMVIALSSLVYVFGWLINLLFALLIG